MLTESSELTSLNVQNAIANIKGGDYRSTTTFLTKNVVLTVFFAIIIAYLFLLYRDSCTWLVSRDEKSKSDSSKSLPSKSVSSK
jgi:hypothetical protein